MLLRNPLVRGNIHLRTLKNIACQRVSIGCEALFCISCIYLSCSKGLPTSAIVAMCVTVAVVVVAVVIWWCFVEKKTNGEDVALLDSGLYQYANISNTFGKRKMKILYISLLLKMICKLYYILVELNLMPSERDWCCMFYGPTFLSQVTWSGTRSRFLWNHI